MFGAVKKISELFKAKPVDCKVVKAGSATSGDFDFYIHSDNDKYISRELEKDGIWEIFETEVFTRLCREDEFILDIGANIGWYTAIGARLIGETGRIYAFEPDPSNYALLRRNVAALSSSSKVRIFNCAIGDKQQRSKLFLSPINRGDHNIFASQEGRSWVPVEFKTLDRLLMGQKELPTLLKCDTQGSEARVLRGAQGLFAQGWRPDMILEFWPYGLHGAGDDAGVLWQQLDSYGYVTFKLVENEARLSRLNHEDITLLLADRLQVEKRRFINLLCMHQSSKRFYKLSDLIDD